MAGLRRSIARETPDAPVAADSAEAPWAVAGALGAIAAAELLVVFVDIPVGAVAHALLAFGLIVQWVVVEPAPYRRGLAALALVPLIRILSMALVLPDLPSTAWGGLAAAALIGAAILMVRAIELAPEDLRIGLPSDWTVTRLVILAAVVAALLVSVGTLTFEPMPTGGLAVAFLVLAAVAEELTFRGVIQGAFRSMYGRAALLYANFPFVVVYLGTRSVVLIVVIAVLGIALGWAVERSRSIWPAIIGHAVFSLGVGLGWPAVLDVLV